MEIVVIYIFQNEWSKDDFWNNYNGFTLYRDLIWLWLSSPLALAIREASIFIHSVSLLSVYKILLPPLKTANYRWF